MRAVVFEAFGGPILVREVPPPVTPEGGAVIRVEATGLCRSDWHGWMGHDPDIRLPHVPGHEFVGTIEFVGVGVRTCRPGDRVTVLAWELEIVGSHGMAAHEYPEMLAAIASGRLRPDRLVGRTLPLEAAPAALMAMSGPPSDAAGMTVVLPGAGPTG